jgi:putative CocE/NonD family hydrolase
MSEQITVEFDVPAPMRDGVILRANIFRPVGEGSYPVALMRTPYGKDFGSVQPFGDAVRMARAGYIVVLQDVRGRYGSDGEWRMFQDEAADGYDSVEWAARLPGANGNVGMYGASYVGLTQWMAAKEAPPSLKALVPSITFADARDGVVWRGGALELGLLANWMLGAIAIDITLKRYQHVAPAEQMQALGQVIHEIDQLRTAGYFSLPLKDFEPLKRLGLATELGELIENADSFAFSASFSIGEFYDRVRVPTLNIGGWYDIFIGGTLGNFQALQTAGCTPAARQSKLVVGPWSHVNLSNTIGEIDFGFTSQLAFMNMQTDLTGLTLRWFDYWLKGIENGVTNEPPIKLFVMGANVWRDEQEWPLARAQATAFYLHADGVLSPTLPGDQPPDHYTYDPNDPTPTSGGNLLMHSLFNAGVKDQRAIEARADVLTYTSAPLEQDLEVTGPLLVKLWAASDALDTDFVARLVDVYPDGFAQNLADGIIRARYRNSDPSRSAGQGRPELLTPGQPYEFTIDLWATASVFKAGHRIRVDIASASFPRWDRNPNTGAPLGSDTDMRPARQTILHDAAHPSRIVLPVVLG